LGKRVDYSARSVIVGDPTLQLHQCGLPTKICLELFKPFLIRRLIERRVALSPRAAKRMVERSRHRDPVVWDVLEEVMYERAILLNRAPTLHRLGIQAFEAVRVEGNAIRLHPLVCSAYNADFDGDQMAVHLPLSDEAQKEAWELLLSTHNLRSSASGEPSISLGQDIALGLSYLTQVRPTPKSNGRIFTDTNEALLALDAGVVDLHTLIFVRTPDPFVYTTPQHRQPVSACCTRGRIETTPGRLLLNEALPQALRFRNYRMTKERIKQLIADSLRVCGSEETADLADRLKTLGFHIATRSGTSFAISDIETLSEKHSLLEEAQGKALEIEEQFLTGTVTEVEREQQLVTLWTQTSDMISKLLEARLDPFGTLATIIISGATKAKFQQIRQLSGMRGLMAGPGGRIIPIPILGNYLQGQAVWEAFIAASGARAGFMARSLNTAVTGYLTRKLVEVGQEVWITEEDCGTLDAVTIDDGESRTLLGLPDMSSRLIGRVLAEPSGSLSAGTLLDEALSAQLVASGVARVRIRSPLVCQAHYGLCRRCYGWDLATWQLVAKGLAVGVIAGQSIGEPGTQLSMRVFHTGGIAGAVGDIRAGLPRVIELFEGQVPHGKAVISRIDGQVDTTDSEESSTRMVYVTSPDGERQAYPLLPGTRLLVEVGQQVKAGAPLTTGPIDPGDLLRTVGWLRTAQYLVQEIQHVFRGTGVYINERHVELIVRQMTRFTLITDPGDTTMVVGEILDRYALLERNAHVLSEGGSPAIARPVLLGITKAAKQTRSWVAAASFQDTSRVLAWAAVEGRTDNLRGLKARIVVGKPIPRYGSN
jgi:DNA-directed RNA polymerase subunit beta'